MAERNAKHESSRLGENSTRRSFLRALGGTAVITALGGTVVGIQKLLEKNLSEDEVDRMLAQDEETSNNLANEIAKVEKSISASMSQKVEYEQKYGKQDAPILRIKESAKRTLDLPQAPRTREKRANDENLKKVMQGASILKLLQTSYRTYHRTAQSDLTPSLDALFAERREQYLHQYPQNGVSIDIKTARSFTILVASLAESELRARNDEYGTSHQIHLAESERALRTKRRDLTEKATREDVHKFGMPVLHAVITEFQTRFPDVHYFGNEEQLVGARGRSNTGVHGVAGFHDAKNDTINLHLDQSLIDALLTLWHESGHVIGRSAEMYRFREIEKKNHYLVQCRELLGLVEKRKKTLSQWKENPSKRGNLGTEIQNQSTKFNEISIALSTTNVAEISGNALSEIEEEGPMITATQLDESVAFLVQQLLIHEAFRNEPDILSAVQKRVGVQDETVTSKKHVGSYALAREVLQECKGDIARAIHQLADVVPDSPQFNDYAVRLQKLTKQRGGKIAHSEFFSQVEAENEIQRTTLNCESEANAFIQTISTSNGLSDIPDEEKLRAEIGRREAELARTMKIFLDELKKEYETNE